MEVLPGCLLEKITGFLCDVADWLNTRAVNRLFNEACLILPARILPPIRELLRVRKPCYMHKMNDSLVECIPFLIGKDPSMYAVLQCIINCCLVHDLSAAKVAANYMKREWRDDISLKADIRKPIALNPYFYVRARDADTTRWLRERFGGSNQINFEDRLFEPETISLDELKKSICKYSHNHDRLPAEDRSLLSVAKRQRTTHGEWSWHWPLPRGVPQASAPGDADTT